MIFKTPVLFLWVVLCIQYDGAEEKLYNLKKNVNGAEGMLQTSRLVCGENCTHLLGCICSLSSISTMKCNQFVYSIDVYHRNTCKHEGFTSWLGNPKSLVKLFIKNLLEFMVLMTLEKPSLDCLCLCVRKLLKNEMIMLGIL